MATIDVKDAALATRTVELPNANGRAAATASRPVALSTEDKTALDAILAKIIGAPATEATLAAILAKLLTAPATEAKQDAIIAKLIAAPATSAKQDNILTALALLSTDAKSEAIRALLAAPLPTYADNFARAIASTVLTRQANTTAYAAGQVIGGASAAGFTSNGFTFANFARSAGGVAQLLRARLYKSQATAAGSFELRIYRAAPTLTIGDTGVAATGIQVGSATGASRLVARFPFDMTTAALGSDGAELAANPSVAPATTLIAASDLFGVLVATGAYTPLSGETFSVVLEGLAF